MGSDNLEQQLGALSGQLNSLVPTLERMEERLHQAQLDAAAAEARNQALRREFDELRVKISGRLADIYKRIETAALDGNNRKNDIEGLRRDIKDAIGKAVAPILGRVNQIDAYVRDLKKKHEGRAAKVWDVIKILLAAAVGAVVSQLFK